MTPNATINVSVSNQYRDPSYASEIITQAILGEVVEILEQQLSFTRVRQEDGYESWISSEQIFSGIPMEGDDIIVKSHFLRIYMEPSTAAAGVKDAVLGCNLKAIDEFPILCVTAAKAQGKTKITGAGELRVKESDRITSMAVELRKMGVNVEELEDGLVIEGTEKLKPADVQSYGDHRIAMALIIAGFTVDKETTVRDTECINTSFPDFIGMLEGLMR